MGKKQVNIPDAVRAQVAVNASLARYDAATWELKRAEDTTDLGGYAERRDRARAQAEAWEYIGRMLDAGWTEEDNEPVIPKIPGPRKPEKKHWEHCTLDPDHERACEKWTTGEPEKTCPAPDCVQPEGHAFECWDGDS